MIPSYWKTSLEAIEECLSTVQKGEVRTIGISAGGRSINMVSYGKKNSLNRTANLSSALGAGDISCFADKENRDYIPTVLLVGCIHGGEFEGTAALLNLIKLLETGEDYAKEEHSKLLLLAESVNLLIIPCINPDGRSHVPFDSFVGKSFYELRYYNQGTWNDGTLCNWPDCKKKHPIKKYVSYLGGYFNDDGINLMHDKFFGEKASETKALFDITYEYAPDFSVLLHGGTNSVNHIIPPAYAPLHIKKSVVLLGKRLKAKCESRGLRFSPPNGYCGEDEQIPTAFNLPSAMQHLCGAPCMTYESNQGLNDGEGQGETYEEIYLQHMLLFESVIEFVSERWR